MVSKKEPHDMGTHMKLRMEKKWETHWRPSIKIFRYVLVGDQHNNHERPKIITNEGEKIVMTQWERNTIKIHQKRRLNLPCQGRAIVGDSKGLLK